MCTNATLKAYELVPDAYHQKFDEKKKCALTGSIIVDKLVQTLYSLGKSF